MVKTSQRNKLGVFIRMSLTITEDFTVGCQIKVMFNIKLF